MKRKMLVMVLTVIMISAAPALSAHAEETETAEATETMEAISEENTYFYASETVQNGWQEIGRAHV